ncbi:acetoacetyl-CoA reductase/3-oxoacyl-[acyl-carrier protein] reductase [Pontibacter indicus]|uniref:Acetoacetyl-CoA reductase/3-oxoacyl-[acyl-carrier protein] reductase n=2 Tax=Pontibacter indicus TaxID=1317125 RepID=A0A1R3XPI0_9BACT|nr:acetoacetyl-CoA reductase/3-oxoacyl-[acyl-carrier protein] reductase [Pontibacter indicus]
MGLYKTTEPESIHGEYYQLDISNEEEVAKFYEANKGKLKDIVLINAAGISYNAFGHKADIDAWSEVIKTNLIGLFNLTRLVLPIMRTDSYGRIINFSSVVAQLGVPGTSAYATSKAGLWGMSKALAVENGSKNVTINNINLGYFNIGMIEQVPGNMLENILQKIPAGRLGSPEEIYSTVDFIINTPYLNGASIDLNGGML